MSARTCASIVPRQSPNSSIRPSMSLEALLASAVSGFFIDHLIASVQRRQMICRRDACAIVTRCRTTAARGSCRVQGARSLLHLDALSALGAAVYGVDHLHQEHPLGWADHRRGLTFDALL